MEPDFQEINEERVGYRISVVLPKSKKIDILTFEEFVPLYFHGVESHQQVYNNLEKALASAVEQQDSIASRKGFVRTDTLATATLQREAIRNSMDLIQKNYL